MALTAAELNQAIAELTPLLEHGWIQKIHQPADRTLILEIRTPGKTRRLLVSCEPDTARIHLSRQPLSNPPAPPPFCQFLRAHFQGARIDGIQQVPGDRIVILRLTTKNGPGALVCALTGKTANILALNGEQRILRDFNRQHELTGQIYQAPEQQAFRTGQGKASRFSPLPGVTDCPISAAIETHYQGEEAELAHDRARDMRLHFLKKTVKKDQRRIESWREDLMKAAKYRDYARYGELLKANLGSIRKGMDRVTLVDYFEDTLPEVTIPLDPTKPAQGNMEDYFRKHRKYLSAERELKPRIEEAERNLETLRQEIRVIENGSWVPPPFLSRSEGSLRRTTARQRNPASQHRGPFRRFTSADGVPIYVGRNARENDELTFGLAKSDDLWLHARGTPGSHVIVRLEKGKEAPPETLKDAATLALLYSDLKKSGKGDVIYTRRKWVKKAGGRAAGAVVVTQEKDIHMHLDKDRLARLKSRPEDAR